MAVDSAADPELDPSVPPSDIAPGEPLPQVEQDRAVLNAARGRGRLARLGSFVRLSGPGWLQSAITLGGGSLSSSLYLGVIGGFGLLWLQPAAMVLGIIMLAAIAYVTLSTGRRPFEAMKSEINPALAWLWLIASMMANFVWCLPQYTLAESALSQNLIGPGMPTIASVVLIFALAGVVSWFYESGGRGIKIFEALLKALVMLVVVSFMVVVGAMIWNGEISIGFLVAGFIPDLGLVTGTGPEFKPLLRLIETQPEYWESMIIGEQQSVMISAFATAVGINMTFLLPYSMLARGWDRDFRGLAIFDLSTSLLLPFLLATTCVVMAGAARFHAQPAGDLHTVAAPTELMAEQKAAGDIAHKLTANYITLADGRLANLGVEPAGEDADGNPAYTDEQRAGLPINDRRMAAALVKRDSGHLADALTGVFGGYSDLIFGVGVFAMGISTIIILMLINGFVFCEMLGKPGDATTHRIGAFAAGAFGMLGPLLWNGPASAYLAIPTSVFGAVLLPVAYLAFFAMMNSKSLLGDRRPTGTKRLLWNLAMGLSCTVATLTSLYAVWSAGGTKRTVGLVAVGLIIAAIAATHFMRTPRSEETVESIA